jgi:CubicO group peptidase (beta-lactamase class C family)
MQYDQEDPEAAGFDVQRLQCIDDLFMRDVEAGKIPGAVVLLARKGTIALWRAFGFRDREANVSLQRNDIFRIASMTKPITSVAAMILAERGSLLLPEPVANWLPEFGEMQVGIEESGAAGGPSLRLVCQERPMSMYDLLRHTAGLTYGLFGTSLIKTAYNQAGVFDLRNSNQEMTRKLAAIPLAHQPGRVWDYSMATDVLGRVIEVVSGKCLAGFLRDEVFTPLGLKDTGFLASEHQAGRTAQPQTDRQTGQRPAVTDHMVAWPWQSGGGGLFSSALDYLRFCEMLLKEGAYTAGRLLNPATVRLMTADHLPQDIEWDDVTLALFQAGAPMRAMGQSFGLGFLVRTQAGVNPLPGSIGDYGWAGALGTYFWIDPAEQLIAIFLSQAPELRLHYRWIMRQLVYQSLAGDVSKSIPYGKTVGG